MATAVPIIRDDVLYDYPLLVDHIINWKNKLFQEMPFFNFYFKKYKVNNVMDIDCGAGHYVFEFTNLARFVMGVDTNPFLIKKAQEKSLIGTNYKVLHSNFEDFENTLFKNRCERKYECIVSLNNGLSTIINDDNFDARLDLISSHLVNGGIFILNSFNYNSLLKNQDYSFNRLPFVYKGTHYFMLRSMKILDEDLVKYSADIYDAQGNVVSSFEQLQRPITKGRMSKILTLKNFEIENIYSDFNFNKFDIDRSKRMILVAKKKTDIKEN